MAEVSIVIPAFNEGGAVGETIRQARKAFEGSGHDYEIIVVDDGSKDATGAEARQEGAAVIRHPYNIGYGNSLLTGIRQARYPVIAITDADGTYPVRELPSMVAEMNDRGLDMLVGARRGQQYHGTLTKRFARFCFKHLAQFVCGRTIPDINSGLRVMRRDMVMQFARALCGGFSFTTTITIIAILNNRFVDYRPIDYAKRVGKSHVRYFRDTLRTTQILVMTILLFNPIKLYLLCTLGVLGLGVLAVALSALLPGIRDLILLASLWVLGASLLVGSGFLAEQRRVSSIQIVEDHGRGLRDESRTADAVEQQD